MADPFLGMDLLCLDHNKRTERNALYHYHFALRALRNSFAPFYPHYTTTTLFMLQPGTPMSDLFPMGMAAFANRRRPNPPPGFGPRRVMSPTHNLLRASFAYIDQNTNRQRNAKEAPVRRVMFEAQLELEASHRERMFSGKNYKSFSSLRP